MIVRVLAACGAALILAFPLTGHTASDKATGGQLFELHCAACHDRPETKAPGREVLKQMPLSRILVSLEFGKMAVQGAALSAEERERLGVWLAGDNPVANAWIEQQSCQQQQALAPIADGRGNWGFGSGNTRHLKQGVNLRADNVAQLELAWSLAIPGATEMRSQPVIAGDVMFFGTQNGNVLALDMNTGCVHWEYRALSAVRTALTLVPGEGGAATLYFADDLGNVYALNASDGSLRFKRNVKWFPTTVLTGSFAWHEGVLLVPVSSFEVAAAGMPTHECCRSHGGLLALDGDTGETLWEYHTTEHAQKTKRNRDGVQMWGPSGASVWTTPAVDAKRGLVYIGSGENTSSPATSTSDAIIALNLANGKPRWVFQATANDAWNSACLLGGASCPEENGPDFDFGGAIVLAATPGGGDLVLAGQKSGEVFALNPDNGEVVWRNRLSQGTTNGGIHWGLATDGNTVFVPVADPERDTPGYVPRPGVYALEAATGKARWSHPVQRGCEVDPADRPLIGLAQMRQQGQARSPWPECSFYYGQSAAAVLANDVVYAGALDGKLRLLHRDTGEVLRIIDTNRDYRAGNGVEGHGGAIDLGGVVPSADTLVLLSGYGVFGQMPGNMLLVYRLKENKS